MSIVLAAAPMPSVRSSSHEEAQQAPQGHEHEANREDRTQQRMSQLIDRFGRKHTYLRISVTDRCNLRCIYCMPPDGVPLKQKDEILTYEEILRTARVFAELGINKIRITGGEPLVRKNLDQLIAQLSKIPGVKTLAMTTNAVLLKEKVGALRAAGLSAINISLDTLRSDRFREITLRDDFDAVVEGIEAALAAGFESVKLNVVVMSGRNEDEIIDFIERYKHCDINLRFIEYMPFKDNRWEPESVFPYAKMKELIERKFVLKPLVGHESDVAKDFAVEGYPCSVSFITSMTESFCGTCNRVRLTSDGSVKSCLFYKPEVNLRDALRAAADDVPVRELILQSLAMKPEAHPPMDELADWENRSMVEIGG
jgi:GTP 3',8-cyclase